MSEEIERAAIALYDRFTHEGMDRRVFMARLTRLAGGAAAASVLLGGIAARAEAAPIVAADDSRIRTQELVWEPRPGRRYTGYNAAPAQGAPHLPIVLVVHENRGLNEYVRDVARRLAVAGYSAVAPDFLSPAGGTPAGDEDRARTTWRRRSPTAPPRSAGLPPRRAARARSAWSASAGAAPWCTGSPSLRATR